MTTPTPDTSKHAATDVFPSVIFVTGTSSWLMCCFCSLILLVALGCENQQRMSDYDSAVAAYEAGRYDTAESAATAAMSGARGEAKQRAAYVAGVSAFRLRDFDGAENRLLTSVQSRDAQVAGRSYATLGLIRLNQGRRSDADVYFARAAEILPVDEAEAARRSIRSSGAADYARATGSSDVTPISYSSTSSAALRNTSNSRFATSTPAYVIQAGAFRSQKNAEEAKREAETLARKFHLGSVRVLTRTDPRARTLYVVQFGEFSSKQQAINMRMRLGRTSYIVAEGL